MVYILSEIVNKKFTGNRMNPLTSSLKFLSKNLLKPRNPHFFTRYYHAHSLSKIAPQKPKITPFLSPLRHQWRSTSFSYHALSSKHFASVSFKGPIMKRFLGTRFGFLSTRFCKKFLSSSSTAERKKDLPEWMTCLRRRGFSVDSVLSSLIFLNAVVFVMWQVLPQDFMYKHFTLSPGIESGSLYKYGTIISAFSHYDAKGFAANMIGLIIFGRSVGRKLGPEGVLLLYLTGAQGASLVYLKQCEEELEKPSKEALQKQEKSSLSMDPLLGATGVLHLFVIKDMMLFPKGVLCSYFGFKVHNILAGAFVLGMDYWRIIQGDSHAKPAHLLGPAILIPALL